MDSVSVWALAGCFKFHSQTDRVRACLVVDRNVMSSGHLGSVRKLLVLLGLLQSLTVHGPLIACHTAKGSVPRSMRRLSVAFNPCVAPNLHICSPPVHVILGI